MKKYFITSFGLLLISLTTAFGQTEAFNIKRILINDDWVLKGYSINDSAIQYPDEIFFSFKDTMFYWLKTENNPLNILKDTLVLSAGKWAIDSSNNLVLGVHYDYGMWFESPQKIWEYSISYHSGDSLKLISSNQSFVELLLIRVPHIIYTKPNFISSTQNSLPSKISYWNLDQKNLNILGKKNRIKSNIKIGNLITIKTSDLVNGNIKYEGYLFTCDSLNVYLKMDRKYQSWDWGDNINSYSIINYPFKADTILYPGLKYSLIEKIPYNQINSIEIGRISPDISSASLIVTLASFTSSLIIAPLVSYNFKSGNFNQERYYKLLIPSLMTFSISFPITLFVMANEDRLLTNSEKDLTFEPIK